MSDSPTSEPHPDRDAVRAAVREHYAAAAAGVTGSEPVGRSCADVGTGAGCYSADDLDRLPATAVAASIGCANPVAVAELAEGEVVLDLGSGGGADVLLSARRVGTTGRVYGLDMTDEMLDLARLNQAHAGVDNVEFLKGHIEAIPLPDATVDVVLSNCVIALSVDKAAVFAEAFRVLKPGGRLALADVVAGREAEAGTPMDAASWVDCTSGALTTDQYLATLETAGFGGASIEVGHSIGGGLSSVIVRAVRRSPPAGAARRPGSDG